MTDEQKISMLKSPEEVIEDLRLFGDTPTDQYSHQYRLLFHPTREPKSQLDLLPPDALLGLVKDSKTLVYYQNDNVLINRFFDMGSRSEGIMKFFSSIYHSWWQSMRMTGALGGNERWLQSFLEPTSVPYEGFSFLEKRQAKKKKETNYQNIIDNIKSNQANRQFI